MTSRPTRIALPRADSLQTAPTHPVHPSRAATTRHALRRFVATATLLAFAGPAPAHDTWFEPLATPTAPAAGTSRLLALGTGNRFPVFETGVDAQYLRASACRRGDGASAALAPLRNDDTALVLQATDAGTSGQSCWAQLAPFEVTLPDDKIALYLDEARPPASVSATWATWRARGLPWQERYTKHARIELPGRSDEPRTTLPSSMGADALLSTPRQPTRVGDALDFQLLRHGAPWPDQAVEFRNDRAPIGVWLRSDGQGRLRFAPPLPGQWVLRAIALHPAPAAAGQWESDFLTLAFSVAAR